MIAELLEKFEDLFTPHTPEEVEKRLPVYDIYVTEVDSTGKNISKTQKFSVKQSGDIHLLWGTSAFCALTDFVMKKWGADIGSKNAKRISDYNMRTLLNRLSVYIIELTVNGRRYKVKAEEQD